MKQFETVSLDMRIVSLVLFFIMGLIIVSNSVLAQVQYYEINTEVSEEGASNVKMIITFAYPETDFSFNVIGRVENFTAESIAGPVNCQVEVIGISSIRCKLNLTQEKRQIELNFITSDFVRSLEDKFFFSGDFSLNRDIDGVSASLKLPANAFLVGENATTSMISYPDRVSIFLSEDGKILINWKLNGIKKDQSLRFEALYQKVEEPFWFQFRIRHFVFFGVAFALALSFVIFRYFRKSEKLVLSVLDEYERQIVAILMAEDQIRQKKIVDMTNLSKAKVSRVIKSLSARNLIEVERRGRTNLIKLKKKKLSGSEV